MTKSGLFQNSAGAIYGKQLGDDKEALDVLVERIVTVLTSKPIVLRSPMRIDSYCKEPAIIVRCDDSANPEGMQVIRKNGEQATLGVGLNSTGICANQFVLRDNWHTPESIAQQKIGSSLSGEEDPGTGLGYEGYGTGKLDDDNGINSAAPGEIYATPFITMYLRHCTNNFVAEGLLLTTLAVATTGLTGETTATLQTWIKDQDNIGDLKNGDIITITNRDTTLSATAGQYMQVKKINDEWRPVWLGCV